jgi:hypothetical protein
MQWRLWFQTGAKETKGLVASVGEPLYPTYTWYLDTFKIQPLSVPELFKVGWVPVHSGSGFIQLTRISLS